MSAELSCGKSTSCKIWKFPQRYCWKSTGGIDEKFRMIAICVGHLENKWAYVNEIVKGFAYSEELSQSLGILNLSLEFLSSSFVIRVNLHHP